MLGFNTLRCASILIASIETMLMIRKGQLDCPEGFYQAAAYPAALLQRRWPIATEPAILPLAIC